MPGNDVGDRVHNFFAQNSLSQEQHHSPVVDGNWPAHSNNLWVGNQRQTDGGKGPNSYPFTSQHGLNFMQSTPRPEFAKTQSQNQHANLNGYMYGNQFYQTRQDEEKFLAIETGYDQRSLASGGLSPYASQQGVGPEQHARVPIRSEPSESPVSFDLFGGQQMNHQQSNMLQSLQRQQSGPSDVQQVQQQAMLKMQELQRQLQLQQLEARQQNVINQVSTLSKVASGSHPSALVHDTTNSGSLNNPWASDLGNTNWLQRGSPTLQGCSNGLSPTNIQHAQHPMGLVPLSTEQSLYGVPVSGSRGNANPFSQVVTDKPTTQPMPTFNSSFPFNQYAALPDQASGQDGTFIPRRRPQVENLFRHAPGQALTNAINMENPQQANSMQKSSAFQDFCGRQGLAVPSETTQEKAGAQASSLQNEVGLDPTEERILFGSEDNIWAAFGKSSDMNGEDGNPFDSAGLMNGTWSALMHSAVAETSSSDLGVKEEWSGLNFHSTEIPSGTQVLMYNSGRHKSSSAEENLPPNSSLNYVSVQPTDSTNMNNSYSDVQGHRLPYEPGQNLHANSSQRLDQSSEEGSKWSNSIQRQKSVAEVGHMMFGSTSHPIDSEINKRKISGPLTPELGGSRQLCQKSAGWSDVGSAVPSGDAALKVSSENSSNHSQDVNRMKFIQAEAVHGGVTWTSNSGHNSAVNMEVFHNSAAVPNSSTTRGCEETSQFQNNYHSDYWKNTDSFVKSSVSESLGVLQRHVTRDNQVLHSSRGISDIEVKMHEMQNYDRKNLNDSSHSSAARMRENILSDASDSRCLPTGKQKLSNQVGQKNSWPHKFQYHPMGNMDEDLDPPYDKKHPSHSQSMLQQNVNHGHSEVFGQVSKSQLECEEGQSSDVLRDGKGFNKVHSQNSFHGGGSSIPGPFNRSDLYSPNKAADASPNMLQLLQKVDQSNVRGSVTQFSNSGQKVSSEMPEAENSDGSAGHLQRSQSSASQGFGLQLGPPSQRVLVRNHSLSSQGVQAVNSSHSHATDEIGEKSQGQMHPHQGQSFPPTEHSREELESNRSGVPGSMYNETSLYTMPGKLSSAFDSSSGSPYLRSPLQNPPVVRASGQLSTNQSINVTFDKLGPCSAEKGDSHSRAGSGQSVQASMPEGASNVKQDNISAGKYQLSNANGPHERLAASRASSKEPGSVSQPFSMSGITQQGTASKMFTNMWTSFPSHQPLFVAQSSKESSNIHQSQQLNIMESLSAVERQGDQETSKGWKIASELGTSAVGSVEGEENRVKGSPQQVPFQSIEPVQMNDSLDKEPIVKNLSGGSPANPASMLRDIEAFGRSLRPNNFPPQNYSLLNQMQAMKNEETDPSDRALKRMRVSERNTVQQIPSADSRILSFSGQEILQRSLSSQQGGQMTPQDVLASRQDDAQSSFHNNNTNPLKSEHAQISPQMAPSWFNQYETFKNTQMLQMYEAHRAASMNTTGQAFALGKSSSGLPALNSIQKVIPANADGSPIGNLGPSSVASSAAIENFSPPQTLPLNVGQQHQLLKPKKRIRVTSELTPWYKEVSMDSRSNRAISLAETDWAKSTNRLVEKIEEDVDLIEYGPRRLKVKRRLILTTQLMQQLFRPPSATILFSDANSEYEGVAYSISRLALGDACSLVSCSKCDSNAPHTCKEALHGNRETPERNDNLTFAKTVEEFTVRARKLESDFSRLDKRASILDVIVEGQDIEKFSVIYRFAKFHGRVQPDGVETPSSSDARSHKPFAQRYVTALPMPKNLPNMVQCLSL